MIISSADSHCIAQAIAHRTIAEATIKECRENGGQPRFRLLVSAWKSRKNIQIAGSIHSLEGSEIGQFVISRPAPRNDGHCRRVARDLVELAEEIALDYLEQKEEGTDHAAA